RRDQRRGILQIALVVTSVAFAVLAVVHNPAALGAVLFVAGLFPLAGPPGALGRSGLRAAAGGGRAGRGGACPWRGGAGGGGAGDLGGVVLALIVQAVIGSPSLSLGVLVLASLAGLALATRLPAGAAGVTHEGESR